MNAPILSIRIALAALVLTAAVGVCWLAMECWERVS